jgi:hypothetical protein
MHFIFLCAPSSLKYFFHDSSSEESGLLSHSFVDIISSRHDSEVRTVTEAQQSDSIRHFAESSSTAAEIINPDNAYIRDADAVLVTSCVMAPARATNSDFSRASSGRGQAQIGSEPSRSCTYLPQVAGNWWPADPSERRSIGATSKIINQPPQHGPSMRALRLKHANDERPIDWRVERTDEQTGRQFA